MSTAEVIRELERLGVVFLGGRPHRAHSRAHGDERSTFLVYEAVSWHGGRTDLDSYVAWCLPDGQRGFEVLCADRISSLRFPLDFTVDHGILEFFSSSGARP